MDEQNVCRRLCQQSNEVFERPPPLASSQMQDSFRGARHDRGHCKAGVQTPLLLSLRFTVGMTHLQRRCSKQG
jgi:hypothetical protein